MKNIAEKLGVKTNKVNKLIANLHEKIDYVCHYRNIKLYHQLGAEIKIKKVLQFNQEPLLRDFIMFNTNMRAKTKYKHEKDFFKLMNNSIFGKTLQNVEK